MSAALGESEFVSRIAAMAPVKKKRPNPRAATGQEGFSLLETLISIALISVGVLAFALSTNGVIRGNHLSENFTVATHLAQDKLEELKTQTKLGNLDNCAASPLGPTPRDLNITATSKAGGIYSRCWVISDAAAGADLKRIDVTVSWQDSLSRSITLSTLVYSG